MRSLLIVLLAGVAAAQDATPTFRAGVALVKVDVQVVGRDGRPISGLTATDFRVLDEGEPRLITHFGRESEPLDLVLLLDVSGSMRVVLDELAAATRSALRTLGAEDRTAVVLFAREAVVREQFTGNAQAVEEEIRAAVRGNDLGSGTVINGSIIFAARYAAGQPPRGRRAILMATDNQGLNYQVPDEAVMRELYAADATLNVILIGRQRRPDAVKPGRYVNPDFTPSDVLKLAVESGGEVAEARPAGRSLQEMIERIRSRYGLTYEAPPAAGGQFRRIQVELTPEARRRYSDTTIKARAGYYSVP